MTRRHLMTLRLLLMFVDAVAAAFVFVLVSFGRFALDPRAAWVVALDMGTAAILFAALWVSIFLVIGLYRPRARFGLAAEARDVIRGTVVVAAVTLALLFLLHQDDVSRVLLALIFAVTPLAILGGRTALRYWFEGRRRRGHDTSHMLIAGTGLVAQAFADQVESHPALGVRVVGHLSVPGESRASNLSRPVLGSINDIARVFHDSVVDEVGVCLGSDSAQYLDAIVIVSSDEGKTVRVPRPSDEGVLTGALKEDFGQFLVQSIVNDGHRDVEQALKRLIDVVGGTFALVLLSPLMIATAFAILVSDGSPVLFRQVRIGRHGRPFTIYKFRTMCADAEERYPEVAALSETQGAAFKITDDPRITRVGRVIRKWTLDELPQLINVIKGDMSLVGPRPAPPREVDQYDIWHRRRLSVRPGMTGLWQVEARFDDHFDDRAALDLQYIDQWSLWKDITILLRTVPAVLMPRGR